MTGLRFTDPWWLLLVLLAVPTAWIAMRWLLGMSKARRWSAIITRTCLLFLLALALAGASAPRQSDALAFVVVLDVSDSVRLNAPPARDDDGLLIPFEDQVRTMLRAASLARSPDDRIGLVLFDAVAAAIAMPTRADPTDRSFDARFAEGTDIDQALRLAAAMLPADATGRILLISDGNQTTGNALDAADTLARSAGNSIPVDVVPISYSIQSEVMVERVDAPPSAAAESTITVRVVLRSTGLATGTLLLLYDGEPVDLSPSLPGSGRRLQLGQGQRVETAEVALRSGRVHRFEAIWEPDLAQPTPQQSAQPIADASLLNNRARSFTVTPGTGTVLVVESPRADGQPSTLTQTLAEGGLRVESVPPQATPQDLLGWQGHDLVILSDVPADLMAESSQRALVAAVTELGTGLIKIGGHNGFGAGGWKGSPIEPILPVSLEVPDRMVIPQAAVVILLDNSGSMAQSVMGSSRDQQQIANEAAARAVSTLGKHDLVSVIRFSNTASLVVPLGPNENPEETTSRILSIRPGGGTNIYPAMRIARDQLRDVDAEIKHVILLTDGISQNDQLLAPLAADMAAEGIKVSAISVGDEADSQTLRLIALRGNGVFYEVIDPNRLPAVFVAMVRMVRSPMIREVEFTPSYASPSPLIEGLPAVTPNLFGVVITQDREEPGITTPLRGPDGVPLLAHWQAGLGRVAAFTSDAQQWASRWIDDPIYSRFWTQLARSLGRPQDDRRFVMLAETVGEELLLRVEAYENDGTPASQLDIPATVFAPNGQEIRVRMVQTAPGLYEASVPAKESGDYVAIARPTLAGQALPAAIGGLSIPAGAEHRFLRSNEALLAQIAQRTGGSVLQPSIQSGQLMFNPQQRERRLAWTPLWQPLLVVTLLVLMLDIGTRRIAWDRWFSREFGAEFQAAARQAIADRSDISAQASSALRANRRTPNPTQQTASLGDEEALSLVRAAQDQRRHDRIEQTRRQNAMPADQQDMPDAHPRRAETSNEPSATQSEASGLLAAKRRAAKRFEIDQENQQGS